MNCSFQVLIIIPSCFPKPNYGIGLQLKAKNLATLNEESITYRLVECCTPETSVTLCVNYTSVF